jgi:hypothetical protein
MQAFRARFHAGLPGLTRRLQRKAARFLRRIFSAVKLSGAWPRYAGNLRHDIHIK